jgi:citrate synthase
MSERKGLKSDIARIQPDRIAVHGLDLSRDLLGKVSLGDMAFLEMKRRLPTPQESVVFNAIAVALVEHGVSANALVARMTYTGAPESIQGAIAAGLLGIGGGMVAGMVDEERKTGSMENVARMLQELVPDPKAAVDLDELARRVIQHYAQSRVVPGLGHHYHVPIDPRTPRLFEIARENGFEGPYVKLMQSVAREAETAWGERSPINAPGAIGAVASELGIPWQIVRGITVVARAIGLVGHILEEMQDPMSRELQIRAQEESGTYVRGT